MSSSPLVVGDSVIVTCGGKGSSVVALKTADGTVRWTAGDGAAGYASPALLSIGEEKHVVAFTGSGVSGIEPEQGKLLRSYPLKRLTTVTPRHQSWSTATCSFRRERIMGVFC